VSVKVKYGAKAKWGNGWKYGNGTSEPWTPLGNPSTYDRFEVESLADTVPAQTAGTSTTPAFSAEGSTTPTYTVESP